MKNFQNNFGTGYRNEKFIVFFGNAQSSELKNLESEFPELQFKKIRQTHSDIVVKASATLVEADAHYTSEKNQALLISTADCLPIMVSCSLTERCLAIHAGWKGIANRITEAAVKSFLSSGSTSASLEFHVGPHIQQKSFEVSSDVFTLLVHAQYGLENKTYFYTANSKYYVDLNQILLSQLKNILNSEPRILFSPVDTKTDLTYHSYRRGKETKERNLSFVAVVG